MRTLRALLPLLFLILASCAGGPRPIQLGAEACDYCRMTVSDARYAAELVTSTGQVRVFDSIECLAAYFRQARAAGAVRSVWVTDARHPGMLVDAGRARFVRTTGGRTPMGVGYVAFAPDADTAALRREYGTPPMRWPDLVADLERTALDGAGDAGHAAARLIGQGAAR